MQAFEENAFGRVLPDGQQYPGEPHGELIAVDCPWLGRMQLGVII